MSTLSFYAGLLAEVKSRIRGAQKRAVLAANAELIHLYWDIGRLIDRRQQEEGWGAGVIPRLATDLHNELPELKGFSERNIKRMLTFFTGPTQTHRNLCHRLWHKSATARKCHSLWPQSLPRCCGR